MALTDNPTLKPSKGATFIAAASLAAFLFFFTQPKTTDIQKRK